ncbi:CTP synthase [Thermosporothrix hazakensis]|jgi:CTP synthase|uniref:CTP synthase n=1 Tax=Thermosporothrix hazakensis TaxID=644383 RepID=A0A326U6E9_THEHA|nr:CTP synthase [Thermosporothrix hazakensis]PZW19708.1 CTP synthase [Thermosporothrix hazakensis]GCE48578.1 CTP synthase [Thermosporothrix hazakensis]
MSKFIFVTGGVASSVGKGISVASIGRLLKNRGVSVSLMKLDPYINVDPGTMSPYQHGEVFVTDDGAETDLDLGHYERFTDEPVYQANNITTGQVYASVIAKERRGEYLGGTIQVIPHITNEIKERIHAVARRSDADVVIVEVGGTVGDIEGEPFLEAIRQMRTDVGRRDVLYLHVTLLPYIGASKELKTKPTQHSVKELLRVGIQPDVILCRSDYPVSDEIREKIALFCNVETRAVIPMETAETIYEVPLTLEEAGLGEYIVQELGLKLQEPDMQEWRDLVARIKSPRPELTIGLVGKYVELHDAYMSVAEALHHAGWHHDVDVRIKWINSEALEKMNEAEVLEDVAGIIVPGGFGHRGIEGKIKAASFARRNKIPYLGLCLGMQVAVIEFARNVLGLQDANSSEFDPQSPHPVIDLMLTQRQVADKGGTMRLGNWVCCLTKDTKAYKAYNEPIVFERHRHRYEFNNEYRKRMEANGLIVSGRSADNSLVEIIEVKDHPWYVASQFHPEFKSRPTRPHPLFRDFVGACKQSVQQRTLGTESETSLDVREVLPDSRVER